MKVAFFYHLKFGGAKRVVMDQVKGFKKERIYVDVYTINHEKDFFDPSGYANNFSNYNFDTKFINLPIIGQLFNLYYVLFSLKKLQKKIAGIIDEKKYDYVIVHPDIYTQAPYLLRFLSTTSIYYSHEVYRIAYEHGLRISDSLPFYIRIFENFKRFLIKIEDRKNTWASSFIMTTCYSVRDRMIQAYGVYPLVVPPGIDIEVFKPRGYKKTSSILFVGSKTDKIDGFDLLSKALLLLPKSKRPKIKFVTWKKKNNQRIGEKELAKIYETSKVTMCMSRFENFGLIPLESMACGTPVIATNIGGHRESIIDGKTGFLIEPDPREIAEKIKLILENKNYNKISLNCVNHIKKNWSLEMRNKQLLDTLKYLS